MNSVEDCRIPMADEEIRLAIQKVDKCTGADQLAAIITKYHLPPCDHSLEGSSVSLVNAIMIKAINLGTNLRTIYPGDYEADFDMAKNGKWEIGISPTSTTS